MTFIPEAVDVAGSHEGEHGGRAPENRPSLRIKPVQLVERLLLGYRPLLERIHVSGTLRLRANLAGIVCVALARFSQETRFKNASILAAADFASQQWLRNRLDRPDRDAPATDGVEDCGYLQISACFAWRPIWPGMAFS